MRDPELILATDVSSPLGEVAYARAPFRVGAVQERWRPDPDEHRRALAHGIRIAGDHGASLVCLPELTLSPYFAVSPDSEVDPEELESGPTLAFATEIARQTGACVQASLYERAEDELPSAPRGYNTCICVAPDGRLLARTRKVHIPSFDGYREEVYFRPAEPRFPVVAVDGAQVAFPTCWDQWFPELARTYGLNGAELIVYPTAIGSEPNAADFDSQPVWQHVIVGHGITSATFMLAVNRIGTEAGICFYGSSFVSDPFGRVLAQAPRDRAAVLVADLQLEQRREWLDFFGLMRTRRPEAYGALVEAPGEPASGAPPAGTASPGPSG
ncbi:MAG: nitrilase-related carbon-nitrogen hydrolase [Solirubrobacteraceae bacterium]